MRAPRTHNKGIGLWISRQLVLLLSTVGLLVLVKPSQAQDSGLQVLSNEAIVDFPNAVEFRLELDDGLEIAEAELTYQVGRASCISAGTHVPVSVEGSALEWTWVMSRSGNPPPGAEMWWEWTFEDSEGNLFTTPRESLTFSDDRFEWRTITSTASSAESPIILHWYEGDDVGPVLLEAAEAGLEILESETGIVLDGEVEIFVYGDPADMRGALIYVQDWAGGLAFSEYNTILLGVTPDIATTWGSDTIRHELAHLAIGQFGHSCLGGSRPTWLEEGLATFAEGEPDDQVLEDIEKGIEDDAFQPVRSLNGAFPAHSDAANAAYSQSYSLVDFLIDVYGAEKLQALILELAAAEGYDDALEKVYGFNADGLELLWREHLGAPPRQIPPTPTPLVAAAVPTVVPLSAGQSQPTPSSIQPTQSPPEVEVGSETAVEDDASPGICGLGLIPILMLGFVSRRAINRHTPRQRLDGDD